MRGRGCGDAAQFFEDNGARARIGVAVVEQLGRPVRAHGDGMNFEGQACGINLGVQVPGFLGFVDCAGDGGNPFVHDRRDAVANCTTPAVKLKRGRAEKTAPREDAFFDQNQPLLQQTPQAGHAFGRSDGRPGNFLNKNRACSFDGSQLKILLGTKMSKEAALAHVEIFRERADGEALEALDRSNVDGAGEDGFAGAKAAGLAARSRLLARGAYGGGHEKIVTRENT